MEFFPATLTRAESDDLIDRTKRHFAEHGFGLWAMEIPDVAAFAGTAGLLIPSFEAHFTPCVEIGWRLGFEFWGKGYASEAARAILAFGFRQPGFSEIVSFTAAMNWRSRRLMERLGMYHSVRDNFHHPNLPGEHPLALHVLYRIKREGFFGGSRGKAS
jgi:RimJ/RimL family protein N-acetyltransferase